MEIVKVVGREILDSRGNPTVEVDVHLASVHIIVEKLAMDGI